MTAFQTLAAAACLTSLALASGPLRAQTLPDWASRIDARAIAVISDGDFRASTYRDNRLAAPSPIFAMF